MSEQRRREVTNTPVRFRQLALADLPDSEPGRKVKAWCKRWGTYPTHGLSLEDFENNRGRGLWLHGEPGTGKTRMASIVVNYMGDLGWSSKFVTMADYYDLSLQPMRARDDESRDWWQGLYECYDAGWNGWRCVALDDMGKEHSTASRWAEDNIDSLLRNRFNDGAPTIVTTNLALRDIASVYNASMRDFIYEAFVAVEVAGGSKRRGR